MTQLTREQIERLRDFSRGGAGKLGFDFWRAVQSVCDMALKERNMETDSMYEELEVLRTAVVHLTRYADRGFMDDVRGDVTVSDDSAIAAVRRALKYTEATAVRS